MDATGHTAANTVEDYCKNYSFQDTNCAVSATATKYLNYIDNKKAVLTKTQRQFTERKISNSKHSILIYKSKGIPQLLNGKVENQQGSVYVCQDFAIASAGGAKVSLFNSVEAIKNSPYLHRKTSLNFYSIIPKIGYYFNMKNLFTVLTNILSSINIVNSDITKGYLLKSTNHGMSIVVSKKAGILRIKFYDPNITNINIKIVLLNPEDSYDLTWSDFLPEIDQEKNFLKDGLSLLSNEAVSTRSEASIYVSTPVNSKVLFDLLLTGHFNKTLSVNNNVIKNPIILQKKEHVVTTEKSKCANSTTLHVIELPGFYYSCRFKKIEAVSEFIEYLLNSNNSIEDKIKVFFQPEYDTSNNFITNSFALGNNIWILFIEAVLKNKNISGTEKVKLIMAIAKQYDNIITLLLPAFFSNAADPQSENKRLTAFSKYINYILNADELTESEKLILLSCKCFKNEFWPYSFIIKERQLVFFITYLDLILATDKLSNTAKVQLLDVNLTQVEKEILLYKTAIDEQEFSFIINYVKKIIASSLSENDKYKLLKIENKSYYAIICAEVQKSLPEIAKLYENARFQG